jgi:hypothetical protein
VSDLIQREIEGRVSEDNRYGCLVHVVRPFT